MRVEAKYWEKTSDGGVRCTLCPHYCEIDVGKQGICRIRGNENGTLYSLGYGETTSLAMDPIEKKPLFHFKPGSYILSVSPNGCNLRCRWCQNWQISQSPVPTRYISSKKLVEIAKAEDSSGIAFTYTEPIIWFEYILDVAKVAKPEGLAIVLVTNGYINPEPLKELLQYVDAMNIDLKTMNDDVYKKYIGGRLDPVLETIETAAKSKNCLVEVTNLVIPTLNDSAEDFQKVADFISAIDKKIPLHISRYYPSYRLDIPATPPEKLMEAYQIAKEKLDYVYVGNVRIKGTEDTHCPRCGNLLVKREAFFSNIVGIKDGKCTKCGGEVDFVL
ncbi:AmmeMemoRadiSam system radical SAM enzyme [bacterium]|nr:MAG: AmmeMemoRadiSam system radical SAM enzyme [bacterium]